MLGWTLWQAAFPVEKRPQLSFKKHWASVRVILERAGSLNRKLHGPKLLECHIPYWATGTVCPDEQPGLCPPGSGCHGRFCLFSTFYSQEVAKMVTKGSLYPASLDGDIQPKSKPEK